MEFNIKNGEDLAKALAELSAKSQQANEAASGTDARLSEFVAELKDLKSTVSEFGARFIRREDGAKVKLPVTQKDWAKHGMNAILLAPVGLKRTRDGFDMGDGPVAKLQDSVSLMMFECALRKKNPTRENMMSTIAYREKFMPAREEAFGLVKEAFNISNAGEGLEWIPDRMSAEMIERIRLGWKVAGLFKRINMPGSPYTFPVFRDDATTYYVATPTTSSGSDVTEGIGSANITDDMTFTGKRFMTRLIWSWDYSEDTIIEAAGEARDVAAASMSNAWEKALLDGDADGSHQDSDVSASDDVRVAINGLRKAALAGSASKDVANNALDTAANWNAYVRRGVFTPMGKYGVNGADVAIITGVAVSNQVRAIERFSTAEVFANALNKLANINDGSFSPDGISDFVVSEFVRENLNASGVYDGATTDKTYFLVVNKKAWRVGQIPTVGFKVLDQTRAAKAQTEILFTQRGDFQQAYDFDSNHTGIGYDVTTS